MKIPDMSVNFKGFNFFHREASFHEKICWENMRFQMHFKLISFNIDEMPFKFVIKKRRCFILLIVANFCIIMTPEHHSHVI